MTAPRDPFAHYRARLAAAGFRPSSARGQNFLLDPTLHRWIAEAAAPGPRDVVLEIGVGLGFLTRELAARARTVVGVEIDERLVAVAGPELRALGNVALVTGDALGGPGRRLSPAVAEALAAALAGGGRLLVVANLPYSVSGPLLAELAQLPRVPDAAVVLLQRELAERCAAAPGSRAYGGLGALLQSAFTARVLRTVPPEVFRPRPKVASAVIRLERRTPLPLPEEACRQAFARFLRALFGQRRKTLRTTLPRALAAASAPGAGGLPGDLPADLPADLLARRAEALGADELVALWRRLRPD